LLDDSVSSDSVGLARIHEKLIWQKVVSADSMTLDNWKVRLHHRYLWVLHITTDQSLDLQVMYN
jgi:hypothetical protein